MASVDLGSALYSISQIREIEALALAQQGKISLMQKAGKAAAELAMQLCPNKNSRILVLAGPGNNGGDAYEAASCLSARGYPVSIIMLGKVETYSIDAQTALRKVRNQDLMFLDLPAFFEDENLDWSLIIDGLFGIGLMRAPEGDHARLIEFVNHLACEYCLPVLALDVPSGLNANTGQVIVADKPVIQASHTMTYIGNKPGLHTGSGQDYAGQVTLEPLDVPADLYPDCHLHLNQQASVKILLAARKQNSHKGSFGDVIVLGGAAGMAGAAILAARAAQFSGAGRVFCSMLTALPDYDSLHPEIMFRHAADLDFSNATVVIGPGLGNSSTAFQCLVKAVQTAKALVLDADALNLIAASEALKALLCDRKIPGILTPHPLEAARLLKLDVATVQADRVFAARELAKQYQACVVLKGSGSVICDPEGVSFINTSGNPGLASGGTGDVLAGVVGALCEQTKTSLDAARLACWAHGHAADQLVARGTGPLGLSASELLPEIRHILNQLTSKSGKA